MNFRMSFARVIASPSKLKIVSFMLKQDALMSEREISRLLGVSHMTVNRTMRELEQLHFAGFRRIGKAYAWGVNKKSYAYGVFSQMIETMIRIKDPLSELKSTLIEHLPLSLIREIVLFGSVARGEARPDSDLDLFILVEDEKAKAKVLNSLESLGDLCLEKFGNMLAPYVLTIAEMHEKRTLKLLSEIEKGTVLFRRNTDHVLKD